MRCSVDDVQALGWLWEAHDPLTSVSFIDFLYNLPRAIQRSCSFFSLQIIKHRSVSQKSYPVVTVSDKPL